MSCRVLQCSVLCCSAVRREVLQSRSTVAEVMGSRGRVIAALSRSFCCKTRAQGRVTQMPKEQINSCIGSVVCLSVSTTQKETAQVV